MAILQSKYGTTTKTAVHLKEDDQIEIILSEKPIKDPIDMWAPLYQNTALPFRLKAKVIYVSPLRDTISVISKQFSSGAVLGNIMTSFKGVNLYEFISSGSIIIPANMILTVYKNNNPVNLSDMTWSKETKGYSWVQLKEDDVITSNKGKQFKVLYLTDKTILIQEDDKEPILIRSSDNTAMDAFNLKWEPQC